MIYYKAVKVTINILEQAKIIFDMVVWPYGLFNSIVFDKGLLFIFKFWLSLCYFFNIKQKLSTGFYCQINSQIECQNSNIEINL